MQLVARGGVPEPDGDHPAAPLARGMKVFDEQLDERLRLLLFARLGAVGTLYIEEHSQRGASVQRIQLPGGGAAQADHRPCNRAAVAL